MATGYTRQSSADIIDGGDVTADIFNAEFNQIQSAFNAVSGHNHDGTGGGGAPIPLGGNAVSGTLPVGKGGTGAVSLTAYGVLYGNGTSALQVTNAGTTDGHVLRVVGGVPAFGSLNLADADAVTGTLPIGNGGTGGTSASTSRTALGVDDIATKKSNLGAIVAPGATNDTLQGYGIGSVWVNTADDTVYMCVDATAAAAVWKAL
jgi:hypothetical protein